MICTYLEIAMRLGRTLSPAQVALLEILHDPWCPVVAGDGHAPCHPIFRLDGREIVVPENK